MNEPPEGENVLGEEDLLPKRGSTSVVWRYFGYRSKDYFQTQVLCKTCRAAVATSRGNTTNLHNHLKYNHRELYEECSTIKSVAGMERPTPSFWKTENSCESPAGPGLSEGGASLPRVVVFVPAPSLSFYPGFPKTEWFDHSLEDLKESTALQATPNQNYISDAAMPPGEPWLREGPSRAMLSLPFCLHLWWEPEPSEVALPGSSSKELMGDMKVFAKHHLQEGLIFGPFVGEVARGQLQTSLSFAWVIRDDADFYYIDASDENKSNWMRYVSYARSEEDHNLIVFQLYRQIYYRTSKPIPEGVELKVWIGKDYAGMLGLGMDPAERMRYDVGKKEAILRLFQDIQVVTLQEPSSSSAGDSCAVPASSSSSMCSLPFFDYLQKYDFIPGTEKMLIHPSAAQNGLWYFYGFEPDPTGQPLDWSLAVCKLCGEQVASGDGQSHLMSKHDIRPNDITRALKDRSSFTSGQRFKNVVFSSSHDRVSPFPPLPQTIPCVTSTIANFLIRDLHQPAMVEGEGFRQLIHTLLPSYKDLPSACMLGGLLKDLHIKGKRTLLQLLKQKIGTREEETIFDYTAPIEIPSRRRGRPPSSEREAPHFVTLSVDAWFHEWQGDSHGYATLWAHFIDADFRFQNLALTTQKLTETGTEDVEAQVKALAWEWRISLPHLVLLGGEGGEKMRLGFRRNKRSGEPAGSGLYPNSTTFPEREDSMSPKEVKGLEAGHTSSEALPFVPCFFSAVQGCIEEVMSLPVISRTLSLFQHVLSSLFMVYTQNNQSPQLHIQSFLLKMPTQDQARLKSWAHSRPGWKSLYTVINTLIKHQNQVCDLMKEMETETLMRLGESRSAAAECNTNSPCNTSSMGVKMAPEESEWKVLQELCLVLKPLEVACQTLAKEAFPRLSLIKPILIGLLTRHLVSQPGDSSSIIMKEVKKKMRQYLASCYDNPVVNRVLCVACSLDPQFLNLGFMEAKEQTATFIWLKKEAVRIVKEDKSQNRTGKQSRKRRSPLPVSSDSDHSHPRKSKRLKDNPPINFEEREDEDSAAEEGDERGVVAPGSQGGLSGMEFLLGDLFGSPKSKQSSVEEAVDVELSLFRADRGASLGVEPLMWWRTKAAQFPLLATVARSYLAAPAVVGSAAQDFLLEAGEGLCRKRMNIPPENMAEILFLHHNRMSATDLQ